MSHLGELRWMLPPMAMCLVLTGIHGYLGLHVLSRKVIFVDLALAQIAALGSICAALLGYDPSQPGDSTVIYFFSLGFTFFGAAIFSLTRMRHEKVPQEAFIGITYATSSAVALLLLARSPGESEHIKEMLVGNILLVTWPTIIKTAGVYSVIGVFHYVFRAQFLEISEDAEAAAARGRRVRVWDFLFYASFGFVITSSVAVAGVLLVFTFLVVPAAAAFMFGDRLAARIALAWTLGLFGSIAGMLLSYFGDLPTGPSVVACFTCLLVGGAVTYYVRTSSRRPRALGNVLAGAGAIIALVLLSTLVRKAPEEHAHESDFAALVQALTSDDENAQIEAVHHLAERGDPHAVPPLLEALERSTSDRLAEHIVQVLPEFGDAAVASGPALDRLVARSDDPFLDLEVASARLRLRDPAGFSVIAQVLADEPPLLVEQKAGELLLQMAGDDFGVGKSEEEENRAAALERFQAWLSSRGKTVRWRPDLRRFD